MDCCWLLLKILFASEPARTATPMGKSANAFKLRPLTLLATLDDERLLATELFTTLLDVDERRLELTTLLNAMLEATLEITLDLMLDAALEAPTKP